MVAGIGIGIFAFVIIISVVITKKKANNVAKTESTNLPEDYLDLSSLKLSDYAGLNVEQTNGSADCYEDVNSSSTNTVYYEGPWNDVSSDLDSTYSQISN